MCWYIPWRSTRNNYISLVSHLDCVFTLQYSLQICCFVLLAKYCSIFNSSFVMNLIKHISSHLLITKPPDKQETRKLNLRTSYSSKVQLFKVLNTSTWPIWKKVVNINILWQILSLAKFTLRSFKGGHACINVCPLFEFRNHFMAKCLEGPYITVGISTQVKSSFIISTASKLLNNIMLHVRILMCKWVVGV